MPVTGLAAFERESYAARDEALEITRRGLGRVAAFAHRAVIDASPVADPDAPGSGRLRASWTIARNVADERFADVPSSGQLPPPPESETNAVAATVQLGDTVWVANGSPCVSTVNDRTSFVDGAIAATNDMAEQVAGELDRRVVSGRNAIGRAGGGD